MAVVFADLERAIVARDPSLRVAGPEQGSVETAYHVDFKDAVSGDAQMRELFTGLFPSGKLTLRVAERRGISVLTLGDDDRAMSAALDRIARVENELPDSLQYVLERVGDANPAFVARVDLAGIARDLAPLLRTGDQEPPALGAGPLHITYYGGVEGRSWRFGLRTDLSQVGALLK